MESKRLRPTCLADQHDGMSFSIRSYQQGDEDVVIALWDACGLLAPQNDPRKDITWKLEVDPERFLVGVLDDVVVATCIAGYDGHRGSIYYLGVHPDHHRRGYGEKMMAEAERILEEAGCPKINLLVRGTNQRVVTFYEAIGYADNDCLSLGKRLIPDQ